LERGKGKWRGGGGGVGGGGKSGLTVKGIYG